MITKDVSSWEEFVAEVKEIKSEYGTQMTLGPEEKNVVLYRGQPDACCRLTTTLERYSEQAWTMYSYSRMTLECAPKILESYPDEDLKLPSREEVNEYFAKPQYSSPYEFPLYEYWIYLRHHGFPSPLLDWTYCPYIAAYFALAEKFNAQRAAIFAYIGQPSGGQHTIRGRPRINVTGCNVHAHRRHHLQKSDYTVCTKLVENENDHSFINHEAVFDKGRTDQDILIKIKIPRSERLAILSRLRERDITGFRLFETEEALIKTLALERIEKLH